MKFRESIPITAPPITTTAFESRFGGHIDIIATEGQGTPVLYGNGIGGRAREPDTIQAITLATGRPSFAVRASGRRNPAPALEQPEDLIHTESGESLAVPRYSIAEAAAMLTAIRHQNSGKPVRAILQSHSAIAGIIAAYHNELPDVSEQSGVFEDMVLAYPAGISGHRPKLIEAIRRGVSDRRAWLRHRPNKDDSMHPRRTLAEKAHAIAHGLRPVARVRHAYTLRTASLAPMLHEIKQRPNAPGITLIAGWEDEIFRVEEYLESLTSSTDVDQIVIAPGSHSISGRPEILQLALDQLEVTKEMRARGVDIASIPLRERIHFPPGVDGARRDKILQLADDLDARTAKLLAKRAGAAALH